jgi:serine/threonine-protein kinase PknG
MNGDRCQQAGCTGTIQDGYCEVCGHAETKAAGKTATGTAAANPGGNVPSAVSTPASTRSSSQITTGTGSSPMSRAGKGSRRSGHSTSRTSRKQLGAGLITLPDLPSTEPEKAIMADPKVPERKRFCPGCNTALKRETGFCGKCGQKYSFLPTLNPGDVVAGQYEVRGAIAYGGLGWIYLGFDKVLSRYVVMKGLLNANDESSAAVAVAERQFLAAVKHPNIVGIYNFVQRGTEGFIVMEYVGGKTLKQIRQERGPLPVAESIAYIHRILPSFTYLHNMGLVYCDFKPDNVMLEKDDVKLIDMGGVRRIDDLQGDIYGTVGYSAPEAGAGPTPVSDLYTVGRSLAVLLTEIHGFSNEHRYALPSPQEEPLFAQHESLYRCLLKATAEKADDRFESAEEMTEQLLGVLREVVALETGTVRPATSLYFGGDILALETGDEMEPVKPDYHHLPMTSMDTADPSFQRVNNANMIPDPQKRVGALQAAVQQSPKSREAGLRLADAMAETGAFVVAETILKALADEDPWDWRVLWFLGRMRLASGDAKTAQQHFDQVYFDLPGELAPKLALGLSAEMAGNLDVAIKMYDLVSRTDPGFVSASVGLSRCLLAKGDRSEAVKALDRVPHSTALYLRSRIIAVRTLFSADHQAPGGADLAQASALVEGLSLDVLDKHQLSSQILTSALVLLTSNRLKPDQTVRLFGEPLEEARLRFSLEQSFRSMARMQTGEARISLVDRANAVRPRTLF